MSLDPHRTSRTSKRISTVPTPSTPKPPLTATPSTTIANHAQLVGPFPVTLGARVILNPHCRVVAARGPVEICEGAVVWEKASVGCLDDKEGGEGKEGKEGEAGKDSGRGEKEGTKGEEKGDGTGEEGERRCVIGKDVVIETGAVVNSAEVGEGSVVECFARVERGARVGKFCKIVSYVVIPPGENVPDYTVLYGTNLRRVDTTTLQNPLVKEIKSAGHMKQLAGLQQLIPSNLAKWQ